MNAPVVFIPGLMSDARVFAHQIAFLSHDRAVMVISPAKGATVEEMAQHIAPALPVKFALVGMGLGGDIALDLLRRGMDRAERVVLISTDPLSEPPQTAASREARMVAARAGRLKQAIAEEVPLTALGAGPQSAAAQALLVEMACDLGEGVFFNQSRAMQRRMDQQKTLRRANLPALVIAGEADTIVPVRRQEFMAGLMPHATVQVIAGAGHLPTLEQPEQVTSALQRFLNGPLFLR